VGEKDACFDEEQDDAVDDELKDKVCGELQVPSIPDDNINLLLAWPVVTFFWSNPLP
jgi:hypothetical protein